MAVVYFFFQAGAPLSIENAKFWPVLATFGYFVTNLRTFWCPFHRPKKCGGAPKIDRYQVWVRVVLFSHLFLTFPDIHV